MSPHLDDAVFGCGRFLASHPGCTVLTVFAGLPPSDVGLTAYDAACGFLSSAHAMQTRLAEDERALQLLGAHAVRLDELDSQYAALPGPDRLADRLDHALRHDMPWPWDAVLVPLGLFHCDHERVGDACLRLVRRHPQVMWIGYEDVLYRRRAGVLQKRLAGLLAAGVVATPVTLLGSSVARQRLPDDGRDVAPDSANAGALKSEAVRCYASQLGCLGIACGGDDAASETFWWLDDREAGRYSRRECT